MTVIGALSVSAVTSVSVWIQRDVGDRVRDRGPGGSCIDGCLDIQGSPTSRCSEFLRSTLERTSSCPAPLVSRPPWSDRQEGHRRGSRSSPARTVIDNGYRVGDRLPSSGEASSTVLSRYRSWSVSRPPPCMAAVPERPTLCLLYSDCVSFDVESNNRPWFGLEPSTQPLYEGSEINAGPCIRQNRNKGPLDGTVEVPRRVVPSDRVLGPAIVIRCTLTGSPESSSLATKKCAVAETTVEPNGILERS